MVHNTNKNNVGLASNLFSKGEIIIYPTDTIYGFGVDATNSEAICKLNKIKNRNQPLSIIVGSIEMLKRYAEVNLSDITFIKKFKSPPPSLPRPLYINIFLPKNESYILSKDWLHLNYNFYSLFTVGASN